MNEHPDHLNSTYLWRPKCFKVFRRVWSPTAPHRGWSDLCAPENRHKNRATDKMRCMPKPVTNPSNRGRSLMPSISLLRVSIGPLLAGSALTQLPASSTVLLIGMLPDHFAESVRLARNSQHYTRQASESDFRATWMLQPAAVVAICNSYNRNPPVRELRKGLFFRGRGRGAGIDSMSESNRTAFQTIYDLTENLATNHCRLAFIQTSDNPRHAPSVQC